MPQKGYFIIADITGYTAFMTGSELDHAQDILKTLFETLHDGIKPPLIISNYQGDAILTYVPENNFVQGQTLLELMENIYNGFALKLEQMHRNTTCTCNACRNIPNLDLKLFSHYGEYVIQDMRGKEELSGPDVIIAHRMMKNSVKEKTGKEAYLLLTETSAGAMQLGEYCSSEMTPHTESYEHIGDVNMYVHCLKTVWKREHEKRRIFVDPKDAWINLEIDIPAPPTIVWDYLTDVDHKRKWSKASGISDVRITGLRKGRVDVGTIHHCAHGKDETPIQIIDWRPVEYFTMDNKIPMSGVVQETFHLEPTESGTHLSRTTAVSATKPMMALPVQIMKSVMRKMISKQNHAGIEALRQMIVEDIAAGKVIVEANPAVTDNQLTQQSL